MTRQPTITRTTCPYCGVGCGVIATHQDDGSVSISGDPEHPANFGRLCSKGSALGETIDLDGRLLTPEIDGARAGWDEALDLVARKFSEAIAEHGPDSVAFYVSGQLLTEDYYAANKLMKGYIGSANIDTNSRLCMASSVAGHRRAFGSDTVPGTYEDLELADLVVLTGSNLAWCHPVLYQRLAAAKKARPDMRVVLIDPRRTMTADIADMHLAIAPDGDVALFLGLLAHLAKAGLVDRSYVDKNVAGFDAAINEANALTVDTIRTRTGLAAEEIAAFYDLFTSTEKTVTIYSQGVNQSAVGTDKVNAILNCHLATGRIGKPGMGPFSVTGQPNAMGGREVGGLANMLAAHMAIENPDHRTLVQGFWQSPKIAGHAGLKAVDLFEAVGDGRIKALWIMATNPADSMPDADTVQKAIADCPFVVVSDVLETTDTVRHAHVKLPATAWGEKDGTVTNSERRISRQRAFLPVPGEARPDWQIIAQVAQRMGFAEAFSWEGPADIFREHAELSGHENGGRRDFDISSYDRIDAAAYENLQPFQWPKPDGTNDEGETRFFAEGGFFTPNRKANMIAVTVSETENQAQSDTLVLNTGRVRDHWHTMTRTGRSPRLAAHITEPYAEIHPADAQSIGISESDLVRVSNGAASVLVKARISERQRPGSVFVPMHWTDQFAAKARVGTLLSSITDPVSGQPASKYGAVTVSRFESALHGIIIATNKPANIPADYWAALPVTGGWRLELAFETTPDDLVGTALKIIGAGARAEVLTYDDAGRGEQRIAFFDGDRLCGMAFFSARPLTIARAAAVQALGKSYEDRLSRYHAVAGKVGADRPDPGEIVCSCFGVGVNDIAATITSGEAMTVDAVGKLLKAGTNCGSCRAEIGEIISQYLPVAAE